MSSKKYAILMFLLAFSVWADSDIIWDKSNQFGNWGNPIRMQLSRANDILKLNIQNTDPILQLKQPMDLRKYDYFEIKYRVVKDIPKNNWGTLYFMTGSDSQFSESHIVKLGFLNIDGQWHTKRIRLNADTVTGYSDWVAAESIKALRWDPVECARGELEVARIAFIANKEDQQEKWLEESSDGVFSAMQGKYRVCDQDAFAGKFCLEQGGTDSQEEIARSVKPFPVKPNTTYRIQVYARNTIPAGTVIFGIGQSRSADQIKHTQHSDWKWTLVPCNMSTWAQCRMTVKTAIDTHGLELYFKVNNNGEGKAWWDKLEVEEVEEQISLLSIQPFPAMLTFVDRPTMIAEPVFENGKKTRNSRWRLLDIDTTPLEIVCRQTPPGTTVHVTVRRGDKVFFETQKAAADSLKFQLPLGKLPAGNYLVAAEAVSEGKSIYSEQKKIFRRNAIPVEKLEPIRQVTTEGMEILVNGKAFNRISGSHFPSMHYRPDFTAFPQIAEYLRHGQEQFGMNKLNVISYDPAAPSLTLPRQEYLSNAIEFYAASYLKQLDFCQANNFYAEASLHMGSSIQPHGKIDFELIQGVVERIRHHPALLGYGYDEPEIRKVITPEDIKQMHAIVKASDPKHYVLVNLCQRWRFHEFTPGTDIASYDYYPFPNSNLKEMRRFSMDMKKAKPNAPFQNYLQTFQFKTITEIPGFQEIYASFIMNLIDDSKSLLFYSWYEYEAYSMLSFPEMQSYGKIISNDFALLTNFMNSSKKEQKILKASDDIIYAIYHNGKERCLLAVNLSHDQTGRITLPAATAITDFFDAAWRYESEQSILMPPYATLVLRLTP